MERLHIKFDELLKLAGQITDSEFLLSLRHIDIADRGIKRTFLEFIVANVKADVRSPLLLFILFCILNVNILLLFFRAAHLPANGGHQRATASFGDAQPDRCLRLQLGMANIRLPSRSTEAGRANLQNGHVHGLFDLEASRFGHCALSQDQYGRRNVECHSVDNSAVRHHHVDSAFRANRLDGSSAEVDVYRRLVCGQDAIAAVLEALARDWLGVYNEHFRGV